MLWRAQAAQLMAAYKEFKRREAVGLASFYANRLSALEVRGGGAGPAKYTAFRASWLSVLVLEVRGSGRRASTAGGEKMERREVRGDAVPLASGRGVACVGASRVAGRAAVGAGAAL